MPNITPLRNSVLIEPIESVDFRIHKKQGNGEMNEQKTATGKVVSIGPSYNKEKKNFKVGDKVVYVDSYTTEVDFDGKKMVVVDEYDLLFKVKD